MKLQQLRLSHQMLGLILMIALVAGLVMSYENNRLLRDAIDETTRISSVNLIDASAIATLDHVLLNELDSVELALRKVMGTRGVEHIEVLDKQGQLLLAMSRLAETSTVVTSPSPRAPYASPLNEDEVAVSYSDSDQCFLQFGFAPEGRYVQHDGKPMFWITRPLSHVLEAGHVGLLFSNEEVVQRQGAIVREQELRGLFFMVVLALLAYWLLQKSLTPVHRLARHMREVPSSGGEPWLYGTRSREVHDIAAAFNSLVARQRRDLQTLNAQREMLDAILDGAPNGILVISAEGQLESVNRAARRILGIRPEHMVALDQINLLQLFPSVKTWIGSNSFRTSQLGCDEVQANPGTRAVAYTMDGACFTAETFCATVLAGVQPEHVIIFRDVTEEEQLQHEAQLRTERLNTSMRMSPDGVALFSSDHKLALCNARLSELLELDARDPLHALSLADFEQDLAERSLPARPYSPCSLGSNESAPLTFVLTGTESRTLKCWWRLSEVGELVMFFSDVTAVEAIDRMKSEFLSAAAHELRTPLTSILGFSDLMLQHTLPPEEQKELLQTIRDQSGLLVNIINEMLDLNRIESRGGYDFDPQPCDVAEACRRAVSFVRPPSERLTVQVQHLHGHTQAWADPQKLHQVLVNLLSNAFKFSPEGGVIKLTSGTEVHRGQHMLKLSMSDQGMGMSETDLQRVFERFFRADKSGHIPGTGLGLPLVKQIMELSGGDISLESTLGSGTTVHLWLPLADHALNRSSSDTAAVR